MKKRLLLFLLQLPLAGLLFGQYVDFKRYTTDEGLAQQFVYSINQSRSGYLYVGTGNGLSVFDGYKFSNATTKSGMADNFITTTYEDVHSVTWIGHFQNGISYYSKGHYGRIANSLLGTVKVNRIVGDDERNVYALSSGLGMVQLIDTLTEKKIDINDEIIFDAYIQNHYFYIATPEGLKLFHNKDDKYTQIELPLIFSKDKCTRIIKSPTANDEYFCSIVDVGIVWFKVSKEAIHIVRVFSPKELKSSALIKDFVIDRASNIWVSCFDDGIRRLNCKNENLHYYVNTTVINTSNGLPSNNIECLFVDNQKNIWLGTYGEGLLQYVNEIFIEHRIVEGETFLSINADRRDNIIIVTGNGLYKTTDSTSTQNLTPLIENGNDRKIEYVTFVNDTLFVTGEKRNSIFIYDIKTGQTKNEAVFPKTKGTSVNQIFSKDHLLYIATTRGLYIYTTTLRFVNYFNHENGLLHDYVHALYMDSKNRLWLASHGTKPYWIDVRTGKITYFNDIQGMNLFNIDGYVEDSNGNIWVATEGDGMFKYNNKFFTKFSANEGLLSNYCYGINRDMRNNIWVGHKNGLTKITPDDKFIIYSANTQVKNIKLSENGIIKDQGNHLWFIGEKSIFKHAIENETPNTVPPSVVYQGMNIGGETFFPATDTIINLPYGKYSLRFDFTCVSLKDPSKVEVNHLLEGHETQWNESTGGVAEIQYAAVSSGSFKFKVYAKNEDGFSSPEVTLVTINIDLPIWLKWWFILCCILMIVLLVILVIRYRTNQLIKNKRELEQKIHEQTIEIRGEKEYISKINKELTLVYKDLTDSINYAKNIQISILPNFDTLKSRLQIYSYLNAKDVVGGDFYGFYELPNRNQIVFLVDCTGHGVPGGFLTVIAKALLDKIVLQMKISDCNEIIQNLNIEFRLFFGSDSQRSNVRFEGLVISLCYIDYRERNIKICAAGTSIYYTNDGEVVRFRGNRDSVGYEEKLNDLETLQIPLEKGRRVYMFSDGLQDQFGGTFNKRYSTKKLIDSVARSRHLPLVEQGEAVIESWLEWKGAEQQIDDVAFIALEVV